MAGPLLVVEDLVTAFHTDEGTVRAVDGVSFELGDGQTLGVVGESGCGKSVTSLSIIGLVPDPPGRVESGKILFEGVDLLSLEERAMRKIRGKDIAMIFQEPMTSLNPVHRIGKQIAEPLILHRGMSSKAARARAIELLDLVGIPAPKERVDAYPHELSGGMRQRVVIAMALACDPKLLIADEPTTALDVTIQAQILELLRKLRDERGMSILFITHDLGVVAELTDEVLVMYAGKVVERAATASLFERPLHPYTRGLLKSIPGFGSNIGKRRLPTIEGLVPDLRKLPKGCRFQDRCPDVEPVCRESEPPLTAVGFTSEGQDTCRNPADAAPARWVACFVAAGAIAGAARAREAEDE